MENFEALQDMDGFCKVLVNKETEKSTITGELEKKVPNGEIFERNHLSSHSSWGCAMQPQLEEPLTDVFDEGDHVRILVQCRCREQQVAFHPSKDGIVICREECNRQKNGPEICTNVCSKLDLRTDELQLENMLFVVAKCNNNNTLEALIPKLKQ